MFEVVVGRSMFEYLCLVLVTCSFVARLFVCGNRKLKQRTFGTCIFKKHVLYII